MSIYGVNYLLMSDVLVTFMYVPHCAAAFNRILRPAPAVRLSSAITCRTEPYIVPERLSTDPCPQVRGSASLFAGLACGLSQIMLALNYKAEQTNIPWRVTPCSGQPAQSRLHGACPKTLPSTHAYLKASTGFLSTTRVIEV